MSQVIPEGWKLFSIDDFLDFSSLFCDGDWVESKDQDTEGGNRLIQLADIGDGIFLDKSNKYMNDKQFRRLNCTELKEGDILIARMPDPLGRSCLFPQLGECCATVVDVAILRSPTADKHWLMYMINSHVIRRQIESLSAGTTRTRISRKLFGRVLFPTPSISDQKRIADILQAIDRAIAHTEALIEKYHQIKAGLMHDLFTRGIGADGKLRPTREEAPELYQESAIGSIPREWGIKPLAELTSKIVDGVHHTPDYVDHGIPFVTVKNLTGSSSIDFENLNYIDEKTHRMCYSRADPRPGDVLVTKDGTLGTCRIVREDMPEFSIFVSVALIRVTEELTPKWLHFFFDSGSYLKQLGYLSSGTGLKHIHLEHFKKFQIALPKKNEQQQINKRVQIVEDKLSSEKNTLSKLIAEKAGLMHDLLTGKVPVKVNPNEVDHI